MSASAERDPGSLSYEEARDELVSVVSRLEQGGSTLEEALRLWERGEALAARCEAWLIGARERLETARAAAAPAGTPAPAGSPDSPGTPAPAGTAAPASGEPRSDA